MRIPNGIVSSVLVLLSLPVMAQTRSRVAVTARIVSTDPGVSLSDAQSSTLRPELDRSSGGGAAVSLFFSDAISAELGAARSKSDLTAGTFSLGSLQMTPVTATLQYHFMPGSFADVYVGVGGAYALFDTVRNGSDFALFDYSSIDFEDDPGWLVNGGVNIRLHDRWAVNFDAKYMRFNVSTSARLTDGTRTDKATLRMSPLAVAAGVTFRF